MHSDKYWHFKDYLEKFIDSVIFAVTSGLSALHTLVRLLKVGQFITQELQKHYFIYGNICDKILKKFCPQKDFQYRDFSEEKML